MMPVGILGHRRRRPRPGARPRARAVALDWGFFSQHVRGEFIQPLQTRVSGSAGTGKTIVALHRAVYLARVYPRARILLTTFSKPLARNLSSRLAVLVDGEADIASRIEVKGINDAANDIHSRLFGQPNIAPGDRVQALLRKVASDTPGNTSPLPFLVSEWDEVVDAQQVTTWEAYRDVPRLGRKTRLAERPRRILWAIFEGVLAGLRASRQMTRAQVFGRLAEHALRGNSLGYEHVVVDEAQDLSIPQARFLAALAGTRRDGLFFTGDLGQRIFQQPFSWKAMWIDVRGRSHTLRINYRTSHQIRTQADRLLPGVVSDVDGAQESRKGTVSLFEGPVPVVSPDHSRELTGMVQAADRP